MCKLQLETIEAVRHKAFLDEAVSAVLMYGSFIKGEGDQYSDVEFYLFCRRDFDHRTWVADIAPLALFFQNEFGTEVAVFESLLRGEFHFMSVRDIGVVKSWEGLTSFEYADKMNLVDKDGVLAGVLSEISRERPVHNSSDHIAWLAESLINNLLMVRGQILRGEFANAQQCFQYVQKYLLWLIRLREDADNHWESPAKRLESEISSASYEAYRTCVPSLEERSLHDCCENCVALGKTLFECLDVPEKYKQLLERMTTARCICDEPIHPEFRRDCT